MKSNRKILLICLTRRGGLLHFHDCLVKSLGEFCVVGTVTAKNAEHNEDLSADLSVSHFLLNTGSGKKGTFLQLINPLTWIRIARIVHQFKPDVIHITSAQEWNPLIGFFVRFILRKPLVYTIHDVVHHEGTPKYFQITEAIFRKIPRFFVVLTRQGKDILISKGAAPERILVVPHGIYDFFTHYHTGLIHPEKEILFFGRIEPYKGLDILLRAIPDVFSKHPDWRLHIAGGGDISPYRKYLNDRRILVTNRFVSDAEVAGFMQRASIVALPYLSASQSGVIPTAFAFRKAVIATGVGGIPDMVQDHRTGILIPPNDPEALTQAINELIEHPLLREKVGENGFAYANEHLGWNAIARKHLAFYEQILTGKPAEGGNAKREDQL